LEKPELYVLELSSFQLETTDSLKLKTAVILNLSPDHLDRYPSLDAYREAKYRIFKHCEQVVINRDDPLISDDIKSKVQIFSFGLNKPKENQYGLIKQGENQVWLARGEELLINTAKVKLFGQHNMANALAALALGESIGLSMKVMLSILETFSGLPHRCEWIREFKGVQWINDSKGTNVGATIAALKGVAPTITGKWILMAGGVGKNADFTPLQPVVGMFCRQVVLIGEAKEELYKLLNSTVPCVRANDMSEAVNIAFQCAQKGDGVLLSPACASLDMFTNFEARGNAFKEAVRSLI